MLAYISKRSGKFTLDTRYTEPRVIHWSLRCVEIIEMDMREVTVSFSDPIRGITGICRVYVDYFANVKDLEREILRAYKTGDYSAH